VQVRAVLQTAALSPWKSVSIPEIQCFEASLAHSWRTITTFCVLYEDNDLPKPYRRLGGANWITAECAPLRRSTEQAFFAMRRSPARLSSR
jgi:hypothetical protein